MSHFLPVHFLRFLAKILFKNFPKHSKNLGVKVHPVSFEQSTTMTHLTSKQTIAPTGHLRGAGAQPKPITEELNHSLV